MWEYKKQIKVRWVSAGLFLISLAAIIFVIYNHEQNHFPHLNMRAMVSNASLSLESAPIWANAAAFLFVTALLTIGVPSVFFMAILLPFYSVIKCFAIIFLAQILASIISMHFARIRKLAENSPSPAPALMIENQISADEFAFWGRLYFSVPLRTVDMFTSIVADDRKAVSNTLKTAAPSIFLRMLIPTCWLNSAIALIPGVRSLAAEDYSTFFMWSAIVIVYTLLPRIPELVICSKKMKPVISALEDVKPLTPVKKTRRKRKGFGIQPSDSNEVLQN